MNLSRCVGWGFGSYVVMKKKFKKYRRNRMREPVGFMSSDGFLDTIHGCMDAIIKKRGVFKKIIIWISKRGVFTNILLAIINPAEFKMKIVVTSLVWRTEWREDMDILMMMIICTDAAYASQYEVN